MRSYFSIFVLILVVSGCRASLESKTRRERTSASVAALELRRVDSLWGSLVERLKYKIEFYPATGLHTNIQGSPETPENPTRERTLPPSPADPSAAALGLGGVASLGSGCGSVKSIEITAERAEGVAATHEVDSVLEAATNETEVRQTEKASEARHDNGTVTIVAVAAAVALLIIIKKLFHK